MLKSLSFLSLAGVLGSMSACVVNGDDDDNDTNNNGTTSNDPTPTTTNSDPTNDPSNGTTEDPPDETTAGVTDTGEPGDTTAATTDAAESTATDDTAGPPGACGWGKTGQQRVPMGYVCGGDGEDPEGEYVIDCPAKVELTEGSECGGIRGQGCCDANGDVWFCATDGADPVLFTESCA